MLGFHLPVKLSQNTLLDLAAWSAGNAFDEYNSSIKRLIACQPLFDMKLNFELGQDRRRSRGFDDNVSARRFFQSAVHSDANDGRVSDKMMCEKTSFNLCGRNLPASNLDHVLFET